MMFASKIGKYLEDSWKINSLKIVNYFWDAVFEKVKIDFWSIQEIFVKIDFEKCEITLKNLISLNSNFEIENITLENRIWNLGNTWNIIGKSIFWENWF